MPNKPDLRHIPNHHRAVSPYFMVSRAADLIDFLKLVFDAKEVTRLEGKGGAVSHATLAIDDSVVMVGSRQQVIQNSTHLYVRDVDQTYAKALEIGSESISEPREFGYGDSTAGIRDPFGNIWWIGTTTQRDTGSPPMSLVEEK